MRATYYDYFILFYFDNFLFLVRHNYYKKALLHFEADSLLPFSTNPNILISTLFSGTKNPGPSPCKE